MVTPLGQEQGAIAWQEARAAEAKPAIDYHLPARYVGVPLLWVEAEARDVTRCPSYYAADWETLRTRPGTYPMRLTTIDGRDCPAGDQWPYYLTTEIPADRIAGKLYSGFAGNNFASTDLPLEPTTLRPRIYAYHLGELLERGQVIVA